MSLLRLLECYSNKQQMVCKILIKLIVNANSIGKMDIKSMTSIIESSYHTRTACAEDEWKGDLYCDTFIRLKEIIAINFDAFWKQNSSIKMAFCESYMSKRISTQRQIKSK